MLETKPAIITKGYKELEGPVLVGVSACLCVCVCVCVSACVCVSN